MCAGVCCTDELRFVCRVKRWAYSLIRLKKKKKDSLWKQHEFNYTFARVEVEEKRNRRYSLACYFPSHSHFINSPVSESISIVMVQFDSFHHIVINAFRWESFNSEQKRKSKREESKRWWWLSFCILWSCGTNRSRQNEPTFNTICNQSNFVSFGIEYRMELNQPQPCLFHLPSINETI